jgi:hypothetical protein
MLRRDRNYHVIDSQPAECAGIEGCYPEHAHIGGGGQNIGQYECFQNVMPAHVVIGDVSARAFGRCDQYHNPAARSVKLGMYGTHRIGLLASVRKVVHVGCTEAGDYGLCNDRGRHGRNGRGRGTGGHDKSTGEYQHGRNKFSFHADDYTKQRGHVNKDTEES